MQDLTGMKFGRLTVLNRVLPNNKWNETRWLCRCECGKEKVITRHSLNKGTKSCGCLRIDSISKHGLYHTRIHKEWEGVKARCNNPNDTVYKYYGARGIKICNDWNDNFLSFYNWAMDNGYDDNLTLDRIDVNKNYEPSNCRWVDRVAQQRNRRDSVYVTINGETKHLLEWADVAGLKRSTVVTRYYKGIRGMDLIKPAKPSNRYKAF